MPEMTAVLTIQPVPADGGSRYTQSMEFQFLPRLRPLGILLEALVDPPQDGVRLEEDTGQRQADRRGGVAVVAFPKRPNRL